jgi:excinuclease ABC subunit A
MDRQQIQLMDPHHSILIEGARLHNLKNIHVAIPRNRLTVITGLSGSGKTSLAFDTLYAEGQRRYVESLSSYARQFLGRLDKPEVDSIRGLAPAIAIEQKVSTRNPRSTVGTSTEIYDYLKVLFARIGKTISPVSGQEVRRDSVSDVVDFILHQPAGTKLMLLAPLKPKDGVWKDTFALLLQQGYSRVVIDNAVVDLEDLLDTKVTGIKAWLLIDRIAVDPGDDDLPARLADSIQTAYFEGFGTCVLRNPDGQDVAQFSNHFERDGIVFEEPVTDLFSFNNPYGACRTCEGFGSVIGIDEDLVIPDATKSIFEEAVVAWRGEKMSEWKDDFIRKAAAHDFPIHRPYYKLTAAERGLLWNGKGSLAGIQQFFEYLEQNAYKIQYRVMLARYRGKTTCGECHGTRLRKEAQYVKVGGQSLSELVLLPVDQLLPFFQTVDLSEHDRKVAKRLLIEIESRLEYLVRVGLGYLTLNRLSGTLSGGESQRIQLATSLGSSLVGSLYILDEPSIGLHPRDTQQLIRVIEDLRNLGNTVVVVEHDEEFMQRADYLLDIGPEAGLGGGEVVFEGTFDQLNNNDGYTARYLTGRAGIEVPTKRRSWKQSIQLRGARENNLKNVDVTIPLGVLTVVTGVSGSGKSTLIRKVFYPAVQRALGGVGEKPGKHTALEGHFKALGHIDFVDQNPIGKSSRSNPVTYVKAYDEIRSVFADQPLAKVRGYKSKHFSFNVEGGRCETCQGEGTVTIEMQFMADVHLKCEVCQGKRFKDEVLEVTFREKTIHDILELTVDEAMAFFELHQQKKVVDRLRPLQEVGLGYIHLGQSSSSLSGGEAQRVKLASFLTKGGAQENTLFIFDEPTTGLHFHDIHKLLHAFRALLDRGHTIVVIEHHPDVIKCADYIVDLGPEGGDAGGHLVFQGTPEELVLVESSYTGQFLKEKLKR